MKKTTTIGLVVILAVIGWFLFKGPSEQQVSKLDTIDTVSNFYDQWLKAVKERETADPNLATLVKSPILSKALKIRLADEMKDSEIELDPVLCQKVVPENITTRIVFNRDNESQILITSRDQKVTEQAIVTLKKFNDGWYIDEIECRPGEFAPEREFSFEKKGFLLKKSVPKPFDPKNWHLIFEENGELGHVVPIFFDSESQCMALDGSKSACKPDQLTETTNVFVQGQMTERGVMIKRLELVK